MKDTEANELELKVILMGPSRVGKTTLLTAVLADTKSRLARTSVEMKPSDTPTGMRVRSNNEELQSELLAGEFTGRGLKGTEDVTAYSFSLTPGVDSDGIRLKFLDFPGGLIDFDEQSRRPRDWTAVQEFQARSTAMVIPVDATVLMEAYQPAHKRQWPRLLGLEGVEDAAVEWAKCRNKAAGEPALLILAPVKCESYFVDNGGLGKDRSRNLRDLVVEQVYEKLLRSVRSEFEDPDERLAVLYCPVDSIGCVEVEQVKWVETAESGFTPKVTFRVRQPGRRSVLGAEGLLVPIVRNAVELRRDMQDQAAKDAKATRTEAEHEVTKRRPFYEDIMDWFTRAGAAREKLAHEATEKHLQELKRLEEFDRVLRDLADLDLGSRALRVAD